MIKNFFQKEPTLSFEVFPPKKEDELENAFTILDELSELHPDFISVTYGAGGSNSKRTVEIASYIQNTLHISALAHLTCVGCKSAELLNVIKEFEANNVNHILALRGDQPKTMSDEQFRSRDFDYASNMIQFLKQNSNLHIAGACYPEKHYECFSLESDLNHLKEKQEAGAEFFISQLFFNNDYFYDFLEKARKKGITIPILAGIMPVTTAKQLGTTISLSGSSVPKSLADLIARYSDSKEDMRKAGIDYAIRQILDLKENTVDGIHIYTMNKPKMAAEIVSAIH